LRRALWRRAPNGYTQQTNAARHMNMVIALARLAELKLIESHPRLIGCWRITIKGRARLHLMERDDG
jgi:hypothetical protein